MTAVTARPAPPSATTLRALAGIEARRYARHPLFLLGVALLVWASIAIAGDLHRSFPDYKIAPGFLIGVLGSLVGYELTRSMARSTDAVEAAPADGVLRTAALCLACLVPGLVGLTWSAWLYVTALATAVPESTIPVGDRVAILLGGVVATVGGPLFGVLVGRWTRFPGAGLVGAAVLVGWTLSNTAALNGSASYLNNLARLNPPFAFWTSSDASHQNPVYTGGSPWWYLGYVVLLCALAVTAAFLHEAVGARRTHLWRVLAVLGLAATGCLALAVAADPTWTLM